VRSALNGARLHDTSSKNSALRHTCAILKREFRTESCAPARYQQQTNPAFYCTTPAQYQNVSFALNRAAPALYQQQNFSIAPYLRNIKT
jgi:hypothetical protein